MHWPLLTTIRRRRRLPPTNQFARQVERGQFEAEGVGVRLDTEETAYFRESATGATFFVFDLAI